MSGRVSVLNGRGLRIIALIALVLVYAAMASGPVAAQSFSVARGNEEFLVCPGESFTGAVSVTNTSDEPIALRVYLADRVRDPGVTSGYGYSDTLGTEPRSFVGWMTFSPERMTLEPGETREVSYEVSIPDDWSLEGSYWGVLVIEPIASEEPDVTAPVEGEMSIGVNIVWRYAIQIFATIADTEILQATFTSMNMEPAEGGLNATAVFQNDGNTFIRPKVWLELRNAAGEVVYTQEHKEQTVLPESARDFVFELRDPPVESGEYLVMIIGDYGAQNFIAAQGRVNLTITPPEPEDAVDTSGAETEESVVPVEGESGASGEGSPSG